MMFALANQMLILAFVLFHVIIYVKIKPFYLKLVIYLFFIINKNNIKRILYNLPQKCE